MDKTYRSYTNILFNKNSFVKGIASAFDLFGNLNSYNTSKGSDYADNKAIYSDWLTTGNDLRNTIEKNFNERKDDKK